MICQNKECSKEFEPKTHNQKYHSDECCRMATNKRIMEKYYEKKSIKNGLARNCTKCKTKLSRYNNSDVCSVCEKNIIEHSKKTIWNLLNELS
jgi:hypothetical protein